MIFCMHCSVSGLNYKSLRNMCWTFTVLLHMDRNVSLGKLCDIEQDQISHHLFYPSPYWQIAGFFLPSFLPSFPHSPNFFLFFFITAKPLTFKANHVQPFWIKGGIQFYSKKKILPRIPWAVSTLNCYRPHCQDLTKESWTPSLILFRFTAPVF